MMQSNADLYAAHLTGVKRAVDRALESSGFDALVVGSGALKYEFLDDRPYRFAVNPMFKWWLPVTDVTDSWLVYRPGEPPVLAYCQPDDYWHLPPADPNGEWVRHFDVRVVREPAAARAHLPRSHDRVALIAEADAALGDMIPNNPKPVIDALSLARTRKSGWELSLMRAASARAVRGHRAAGAAFRHHASELEIHHAYLAAAGAAERELPYTSIVGLNEHGAVLHYQHQQRQAPAEHRSLLIDAGAEISGYSADITRSFGNGDAAFSALLEAVTHVQLALVERTRAGVDYRALHLDAHRLLAEALADLKIVRASAEAIVAKGISRVFFPHGLGHLLGAQVHDVAGFLDNDGAPIAKPEGHPHLRLTRTLEADNVLTIEPGIYFIPMLLAPLRASADAALIDWAQVDHLSRFGGIRIEDNVRVNADGPPENLTRDAFKALAA